MGIPWRRQHGEWQRRPRFACWALAFRSRGSPLHLRLRLEAVVLPHRSPPDGPTMVARRTDGRWTPDLANLTSSLECGHIRSLTSHMNKVVAMAWQPLKRILCRKDRGAGRLGGACRTTCLISIKDAVLGLESQSIKAS
ncbi:unnamed protein product [Urochloa humidicola]